MKATPLLCILSFPVLMVSCSGDPTLGDHLISQGEATRSMGEEWNKGISLIAEGEKQQKKGRRMVDEGEALISKGGKNIERGKALKARVEASRS